MRSWPRRRLRAMSPREVRWRLRQEGRTAIQRAAWCLRSPRWSRTQLRRALAGGVLDGALPRTDRDPAWHDIDASLLRRMLARGSRFTLDPESAGSIRDAVLARWPSARTTAAIGANAVLAGRYDVLGYRRVPWRSAPGTVDWHRDPISGRSAPLRFWADVPYLDRAIGDHKVIWELNRHQHWLRLGRALWLTGDERYGQAILNQLRDWLAANPPLAGINWTSMLEISLRAISWTWALHFLLAHEAGSGIGDQGSEMRIPDPGSPIPDPGSPIPAPASPWLVDLLVALDRQLTHVEHNLSVYFSPNTHLTGEALGLYVVGVALPELASSARWKAAGRQILLDEIPRQIRGDGGHVERSTHYQRYTLDFYLLALLTAERDGDIEAAAIFREAVARLAWFTRTMATDEGRLPLIGDDDGGMLWPIRGRACCDVRDSLSLAAALLETPHLAPWGLQEEAVWVGGLRVLSLVRDEAQSIGAASPPSSRAFADSGFAVLRDEAGRHATFSAGRHGHLNGGHAHADALSITLTIRDTPLLVDPGTGTYTMNPRTRNRLRGSSSHNTVTFDDRPQAIPDGPFHWRTRAHARILGWRSNEAYDWVEGSHDGYLPARHRRTLVRTARGEWLVADEILGDGCITARAHWHFDPDWTLQHVAPGRLLATHSRGARAWLLHDAREVLFAYGDDDLGLGWYAPVYGTLRPTWTVRTSRTGAAPFVLLTAVSEVCGSPLAPPSLDRVEAVCEAGGTAIGARLSGPTGTSVFLVRPGDPPSQDARRCSIVDYCTDARLLHYCEDDGRLVTMDLADASHARPLREGWIRISATESIADLHTELSTDVLDLHSSAPPSELHIEGAGLHGLRHVRLNRRAIDIDLAAAPRPGALTIHGVDWGTQAHASSPATATRCGFCSLPRGLAQP